MDNRELLEYIFRGGGKQVVTTLPEGIHKQFNSEDVDAAWEYIVEQGKTSNVYINPNGRREDLPNGVRGGDDDVRTVIALEVDADVLGPAHKEQNLPSTKQDAIDTLNGLSIPPSVIVDGQKKRIYSSKYALSSLCTCEKCGDVYRRTAWVIRGKHSNVWRCCTRLEGGPDACDAPTIKEEVLQEAVKKAINQILGEKSKVLEQMEAVLEKGIVSEIAGRIADLDERMVVVQRKIAQKATANKTYDDLMDELFRLRDEKESILLSQANDKGKQLKREELMVFLKEQSTELMEFDDSLVRRLVEGVAIHGDGSFTVEFKSGVTMDV